MRSDPACDCLRQDHREVEAQLDRLMAALERLEPDRLAVVKAAFEEIRRLLAVHFEAEDQVFYPAVRPHYPDLLARMDEQHVLIHELESATAETLLDIPERPGARWLEQLRSLAIEYHDLIQHHIVDEENQLFRIAAACLPPGEQERLAAGILLRRAK